MKVHRVHPQARVVCHPNDANILRDDYFAGCPYPHEWKAVELELEQPTIRRMDFYGFGERAFACSEMAQMHCSPLWEEGEFFPVTIKGIKGKYFLFNCTNCRSFLNPAKTVWEAANSSSPLKKIKTYAFHRDRLDDGCVFKIPEDGAVGIFALDHRTYEEGHEALMTLVKRYRLTGLEFKLVWSDKKPKARKRD